MATITDAFANIDNWTVDATPGLWVVSGGTLQWSYDGSSPDFTNQRIRYTDSPLDGPTHYVKVRIVDNTGTHRAGVIVRGQSGDGAHYQIEFSTSACRVARYLAGGSFAENMSSDASPGAADGDWIGVVIEGSGASTTVRVWNFGATDPDSGGAVDVDGNWGTADRTITLSGASYVNSGNYIGLRAYTLNTSATIEYDDLAAGDYGVGISQAIGVATETDAAQAFTVGKQRAIAQATELDTAHALSVLKQRAIAQAVESDTARPFARSKSAAIAQAVESNLARPFVRSKSLELGLATETDVALAFAGGTVSPVWARVVSFDGKTSGDPVQAIPAAGLSQTPKLAIFFFGGDTGGADNARICGGATDGVNEWAVAIGVSDDDSFTNAYRIGNNNRVIYLIRVTDGGLAAHAHFHSWISSGSNRGINIEWDAFAANPFKGTVVLLGGDGFTPVCGNVDLTVGQNVAHDLDLGVIPDFLVFSTESAGFDGTTDNPASASWGAAVRNGEDVIQGAIAYQNNHNVTGTQVFLHQLENRALIVPNGASVSRSAEVTAWLSQAGGDAVDGVEITKRDGSANFQDCYAGGKTAGHKVALTFVDTPQTTGTEAYSGIGHRPQLLIGWSTRLIDTADSSAVNGSFALHAASAAVEASHNVTSEDDANPSVEDTYHDAKAFVRRDSDGSAQIDAGLDSFDADGWTFDYVGVFADDMTRSMWLSIEEPQASGGIAQQIARAVETDAAQAFVVGKAKEIAAAIEADSAQAFNRDKARAIGVALETDEALAFSGADIIRHTTLGPAGVPMPWRQIPAKGFVGTIGVAVELDTAQAFVAAKAKSIGIAAEADSALAFLVGSGVSISPGIETDQALPFAASKSLPITVAVETDSAIAFSSQKAKALGVALETDAALAFAVAKARAIAQALENDSALAFSFSKAKAIAAALEADSARAFRIPQSILAAEELDSAPAFARAKSRAIGVAGEADSALGFTVFVPLTISPAIETDSAFAFVVGGTDIPDGTVFLYPDVKRTFHYIVRT